MEQRSNFKFTDYQRAELENAFKKFVPNAEGRISFESVESLMRKLEFSKQKYSDSQMDQRLLTDDSSESSTDMSARSFPNDMSECDFDTFISIIEDSIANPEVFEKALSQSFKLMDLKGSGIVDAQDLMKLGDILGETISSEEEARRIISRAEDDEGKLTLKSLRAFLFNDIDPSLSP